MRYLKETFEDATSLVANKIQPTSDDYFPALNGLRALAIVLVLLRHSTEYLDPKLHALRSFCLTGWNGVFLFFVLSGFLISLNIFKKIKTGQTFCLRSFWLKRMYRTWPLYFFLLAVNGLIYDEALLKDLWHYLTFTQNLIEIKFFVPTWSLAVEEQFYFVLPLLFLLATRFSLSKTFWTLLGILFIAASWYYRYTHPESFHTMEVIDSLIMGVLLAYGYAYQTKWIRFLSGRNLFCWSIGLVLVYAPFVFENEGQLSHAIVKGGQAFGFFFIVAGCLSPGKYLNFFLSNPWAKGLATLSYSLYLSHDHMVFQVGKLCRFLELTGYVHAFTFFTLLMASSLLLSMALYLAIEKPILERRQKMFRAPNRPYPTISISS